MAKRRSATPEEAWAAIEELAQVQKRTAKENAEGMKELRKAQEKTEKTLRESQQKTEKALRQLTKNLNAANGNFNNKWGNSLENLVKGDLVKLLSKRDIKVDMVRSRLVASDSTGKEVGEFDLAAMNGKEIVTVEVKTTLTKEKVEKFINKLKMFKKYFSEHRDKVLYGGVAFLCEPQDEEAESAAEYAEENGLFVILSPGGEGNVTTMSNSKDFKPKPF